MASKFLVPLEVPNYVGTPADKADAGFALLYIKHGWLTRQETGAIETDLVLARPLDGFSLPLTATPVTNTDTVKSALEKLQQSLLSVTLTGDVTGTAAYNAGVLEIVTTYTGNTAPSVATAFDTNHYAGIVNPYLAGDIVYKDGHIFQALFTNDAIPPTIGGNVYWQDLGLGNVLRQTPVDWNATEGDYQILNKPNIPTLTSDLTNDSGFITSNIYTANGTLTGDRVVTMGGFTLTFERDLIINGSRIGRGVGNIATNLIYGEGVLAVNTTGNQNLAIGNFALAAGTGADLNTALGNYALFTASTADANVAVGGAALFLSQTGFENVAVGYQNQRNNTTGGSNTAVGARSMYFNTTGSFNTAVGNRAGAYITGGTVTNTISANSIYIGYYTKAQADNQTNQIVIGHNETGLGSNTTIIGNSSTITTALRGRLILGTTTDTGTYQLDVVGNQRVGGPLYIQSNDISTAVSRTLLEISSTRTYTAFLSVAPIVDFRLTITDDNTSNNSYYGMLRVSPTINHSVGLAGQSSLVDISSAITKTGASTVDVGTMQFLRIAPAFSGGHRHISLTYNTRAIFIDPTFTGVTGSNNFVAFENTRGVVFLNSSAGSVGIGFGATAPLARLHVRGDSASTGNAFIVQNSTPTTIFEVANNGNITASSLAGSGTRMVVADALGLLSTQTIPSGFTLPALTAGSVLFSDGTTIAQDNANFFWDDFNNRLGIGIASPAGRIHLVGAGTTSATTTFVSQNSANAVNGTIYDDGTWFFGGGNTRLAATSGQFDFTAAAGNIARLGHWEIFLRPLQAGSVSLELGTNIKMLNANVLIGTTTDAGYKLDVNGTARVSGILTLSTSGQITSGTNSLIFTSTGTPSRIMSWDAVNSNLNLMAGGFGEGYFLGNRLALTRTATTFVSPDALNAVGGAKITSYDANGNASIIASNNGNRSIVLRGLGASGAVLIGNITTGNGTAYSAILQADSTTQGFLPPRMTTTEKNAIASPAAGLVVYDSTDNKHYGYDGSTWYSFYTDLSLLGLQNAITTNNVLNTDNAIDGTGLNIDWTFRKTSWNGDGIFDIMMDDGSNQYSQLKVNIFGGGPGSVLMKTYDYTSGNYTSVETYAAALLIKTLQVSTKAAGDVLTLVDPITGEVEYNTPSTGGVTASESIINALIFG